MAKTPHNHSSRRPQSRQIGYARVSTDEQATEAQEMELRSAGCETIVREHGSGASRARPALAKIVREIDAGDTLVVVRLDRLARSMIDLRKIVDALTEKGVGLRVLQQGAIDTTRSEGRLLLNILASFAEFETDIRKERQADGIAKAKAQGKYRGRPVIINADRIAELKKEGLGATAIAKKLGIGRASVYRVRPS